MSTMHAFDALLEQSTEQFAASAQAAGLVDVAVTTLETPVGPLLVAATDGGIVRVAFDIEDHAVVLADLATLISARILEADNPLLVRARVQLAAYFEGAASAFDLPLDLRLVRGEYRREVLGLLQRIPVGATRTYRELAIESGRPNAVRAVGTGCARNPLPIVVPCHRVLRTGGELGGYLGGLDRKRWLLEHEQHVAQLISRRPTRGAVP